ASGVLAVSPDGSRVLYTARGPDRVVRVYVHSLDSPESRAIAGTEGVAGVPFWSTDSKTIAFGDGTRLKKVNATGGPPSVICESRALVGGGFWTSDNRIVFATTGSIIAVVPAGGGAPTPLTRLDTSRHEGFHAHPAPLPDGRHFLYLRSSTSEEG